MGIVGVWYQLMDIDVLYHKNNFLGILLMSKPGKVLKGLCKKLGVRLTLKRGKKRVYKSIKVLKAQCAKKKKLKRIWNIIKWNDDVDVFIMGHTHIPEAVIWIDENENIRTYANTGDWVEHTTYIILKDSKLRLKKYNYRTLEEK